MSNDKYIHKDVEDKIYYYWEKKGFGVKKKFLSEINLTQIGFG